MKMRTIREVTDSVLRQYPNTRFNVSRVNRSGREVQQDGYLTAFEEYTFEAIAYCIVGSKEPPELIVYY